MPDHPDPANRQLLRGTHDQKVMLGRQVKAARTLRGWEQSELGARLGRSQYWISRLECGAIVLSALELLRLASILDLPMDELERIAWMGRSMPPRPQD